MAQMAAGALEAEGLGHPGGAVMPFRPNQRCQARVNGRLAYRLHKGNFCARKILKCSIHKTPIDLKVVFHKVTGGLTPATCLGMACLHQWRSQVFQSAQVPCYLPPADSDLLTFLSAEPILTARVPFGFPLHPSCPSPRTAPPLPPPQPRPLPWRRRWATWRCKSRCRAACPAPPSPSPSLHPRPVGALRYWTPPFIDPILNIFPDLFRG